MLRRHQHLPLLLAALGAAAGCSKPKASHVLALTGAPKTVEWRVTADGKTLGPFHVPAPDAVLPVDLGAFEQPPAIVVQALLPCGWTDVPVQHVGGTETEQRHTAAALQGKPLLSLWVDNRGGALFKASLGQLEVSIPPGFTGSLAVPAPSCEAGAKLRVGDAELPVMRDSDELPKGAYMPAYLIDGSGARCYRTRGVRYGLPGSYPGPTLDERLRPARLHPLLASVDFFLQGAPDTIQTRFGMSDWRHELTEVPCAGGAK